MQPVPQTVENDEAKSKNLPGAATSEALPRLAYSIRELAEMLNLSQKTIRRLIQRNLLKPMRATRHIRIYRQEIERFVRDSP